MPDVPYQQSGLVARLEAERENAVAYGDTGRVAAVDKQLAELGVKSRAAQERKAAAEESKAEEPRKVAPSNRSGRPQSRT